MTVTQTSSVIPRSTQMSESSLPISPPTYSTDSEVYQGEKYCKYENPPSYASDVQNNIRSSTKYLRKLLKRKYVCINFKNIKCIKCCLVTEEVDNSPYVWHRTLEPTGLFLEASEPPNYSDIEDIVQNV
ncbi:unnamed protein product [Trichobilharzia szidati]|nr:unnamed protein product [Trichobilharzia szidati]